jgi:AMMECR1 domain-containing protein
MAGAKTRALTRQPGIPLARALTSAQRDRVERQVRALLGWQQTLRHWPAMRRAPDASPFVSIYADGVLRGCFGSHEGGPNQRLARAFLRALEDSRYGLVRSEERARLTVVVSYVRSTRAIDVERVEEQVEVGSDGIAVLKKGRLPVILLPQVARDLSAGPQELLARLARKAGLADWKDCTLLALRTEDIVVRPGACKTPRVERDSQAMAASWLKRLVGRDGAVAFAVNARKRQCIATGRMHHGRAAVAVRALDAHGHHPRVARRAREWLKKEIMKGLRGQPVDGWPTEPAMIAGTLALAQLARIDVRRELADAALSTALRASPWYGAQVVAALGRDAPKPLWRACVDDLAGRPWAPWTLLAARARGDDDVAYRASRSLCASIRQAAPHAGGCGVTRVPETALTALVVEALDGLRDVDARDAAERARRFLRAAQWVPESIPAPLDPDLACGAFPVSPVVIDYLRCDVAGHALLATLGR